MREQGKIFGIETDAFISEAISNDCSRNNHNLYRLHIEDMRLSYIQERMQETGVQQTTDYKWVDVDWREVFSCDTTKRRLTFECCFIIADFSESRRLVKYLTHQYLYGVIWKFSLSKISVINIALLRKKINK